MRTKYYLAFILGLAAASIQAQSSVPADIVGTVQVQGVLGTLDTITTYSDRMTSTVVLSSSTAGFLLGTGTEFTQTGLHYDALGGDVRVTGLLAFFGPRRIMGSVDEFTAKSYTAGPDSMPLNLMGSGTFTLQNLQPMGYATYIPMQNLVPGSTTSSFFVSIDHSGDDTLCILSSNPAGDGLQEKRTRQYSFGSIWRRSSSFWSVGGQPYDGDALLLPIVDVTSTGISPILLQANGLALGAAYPLPSGNLVQLPFSSDHAGVFSLRVYDATGKPVHTASLGKVAPGSHAFQVQAADWANGTYFYTVQGPRSVLAGKFQILH